jgi:hypothetical protein
MHAATCRNQSKHRLLRYCFSDSNKNLISLDCSIPSFPFRFCKCSIECRRLYIRQQATALNGLDLKQRESGLFISRWPHVLGIEGAGVVEAVGSDARDFQPWRRDHGLLGLQSAGRGLGRLLPRACQCADQFLCGYEAK